MSRHTPANDAIADAQDQLEDAAEHRYVARMAKLGFAARGVLFITVGALAASVGVTASEDADATGAIDLLSGNAFGTIILIVLALGLASYAALRLLHVFVNPGDEEGITRAVRRMAYLAHSALYGALTVYTVRKVLGPGGAGGDSEQVLTARALELPLGRWLVGGAALVLVGVAVAQLARAVTRDFMDQAGTGGRIRGAVLWTGVIGHAAKGVLFGIIAWPLGRAALWSDTSDVGGTDAAIHELAVTTGGTVLLLAVALGVVAYGLWCLAMARWGAPHRAE